VWTRQCRARSSAHCSGLRLDLPSIERTDTGPSRVPWNKGRLTGQKPPLKLKEIWAIRVRLQLSSRVRDLAMLNLAIDSKLRACDLTKLRVRDVRR
jgi:hypothetical protein